ncbi:MAG: sigma-70 family RNA polymerase sigma factor [Polyangiaceae bacterium]
MTKPIFEEDSLPFSQSASEAARGAAGSSDDVEPAPESGAVLLESVPAPLESMPVPVSRKRVTDFRALYDEHVDFVWRNLRRLGVPDSDAEDKTQEVFVVAHRRLTEFEDRGFGARAWLFQIALRVASDTRRHRRRHPEDADGGVALGRESIPPDQASAVALRQELARLDRALGRIEVGRRAVLVLHEIEELTAPEIADSLGISVNTVYSRLRVARAELELALRGDTLRDAESEARAMRGARQ